MVIICKNWKTIEINAHEKMNTDMKRPTLLFSWKDYPLFVWTFCHEKRNCICICYNYAFYLGFNKNIFSWCGIHNTFKYILLNFAFTQYYLEELYGHEKWNIDTKRPTLPFSWKDNPLFVKTFCHEKRY